MLLLLALGIGQQVRRPWDLLIAAMPFANFLPPPLVAVGLLGFCPLARETVDIGLIVGDGPRFLITKLGYCIRVFRSLLGLPLYFLSVLNNLVATDWFFGSAGFSQLSQTRFCLLPPTARSDWRWIF